MHPHHWYCRHPSRVFWFIIGAASATWWIKHREYSRSIEGRTHGHCIRQRQVGLATPPPPLAERNEPAPMLNNRTTNDFERWSFGERRQLERWEEEKDKLMDFTLRATDAMAEMSEATLDTVLETMESLKAKIVENRMKREKERRQLDQQLEDEKKRSSHLV